MSPSRNNDSVARLIQELRKLPKEAPWVEFKVDRATEPETIGEYISALANSAALQGKTRTPPRSRCGTCRGGRRWRGDRTGSRFYLTTNFAGAPEHQLFFIFSSTYVFDGYLTEAGALNAF